MNNYWHAWHRLNSPNMFIWASFDQKQISPDNKYVSPFLFNSRTNLSMCWIVKFNWRREKYMQVGFENRGVWGYPNMASFLIFKNPFLNWDFFFSIFRVKNKFKINGIRSPLILTSIDNSLDCVPKHTSKNQ